MWVGIDSSTQRFTYFGWLLEQAEKNFLNSINRFAVVKEKRFVFYELGIDCWTSDD
jgi:hypothetical protein